MSLNDIVKRSPVPEPWSEGEKIPWDDPEFSRRMLAEHLTDAHDLASRRATTIDTHVDWIEHVTLNGQQSNILDLGCGPGLYTSRLAERGHTCVGIDFSPASIDHAIQTATTRQLDCRYQLADVRKAEFGDGFDLVMMIFGEFNVFRPADAGLILDKARAALMPGGRLLLEVHTIEAIERMGTTAASWRSTERGLFSDRPHIRLEEAFWDADRQIATERFYIIDAASATVTRYAQSVQAYTDSEYGAMLANSGFTLDQIYPSLNGIADGGDFFVVLATAT